MLGTTRGPWGHPPSPACLGAPATRLCYSGTRPITLIFKLFLLCHNKAVSSRHTCMTCSRLGCRERSASVDSVIAATTDQQDQWVVSGERSVELSVAMDREIGKGAPTPISPGLPGSSLAAAPMTFPAARRWSGAWGLKGGVLGRLRLLVLPVTVQPLRWRGPEAFIFIGS